MRTSIGSNLVGVILASAVMAGPAAATVTLELRPANQNATAGQTVSFGLYAVATPAEPVGILQAVLNWDAGFLTLIGQNTAGAHPWSTSGFPGGGLNTDFTDGDAFFNANVAPCTPATATPAGLLVTTLVFDVGSNLGASSISIIPDSGGFTTRVLDNLTLFGCGGVEVPSAIGPSVSVTVQACTMAGDCDDGTACTNDSCNAGVCDHVKNFDDTQFCCNPVNGGLTTLFDGNDCTGQGLPGTPGTCDPTTGQVSHNPRPLGTPCGDPSDTTCTDPDTCNLSGTCIPNHALNGNFCNADGDSCTNDACSDGACVFVDNDPDGTACDDGQDNCTPGQDECQAGVCTGTGVDPCIGQPGDFCVDTEEEGPACPNGDSDCAGFPDSVCDNDPVEPLCLRPYTCGECQPGDASNCPDDGDCLAPTCTASGACMDFLENDLCQDGTFCNGAEVCEGIFVSQVLVGGQCVADPTQPCAGTGLVCREESCCDGQTCGEGLCECVECLVDGDCDDANPCNGSETCEQSGFSCVAGVDVIDCSNLDDQCLVGVCDPSDGSCSAQPDNVDEPCNDGAACTINDKCSPAGLCQGTEEPFDGTVDLQWNETELNYNPPSQAVGETIRLELWAVANDDLTCSIDGAPCPGGVGDCSFICDDNVTPCATNAECQAAGATFCNVQQLCLPAVHEVSVIESIINFDPAVLQFLGNIDPCDEVPGDCIECVNDSDCPASIDCHCPGGPPCPAATNPGVCLTGKYEWAQSGFPNLGLPPGGSDPDGLNEFTDDGEIFYLANARLGVINPEPKAPVAADQALWVTTIEMLAIAGASNTTVSFDTCVGDFPMRTRVIGDGASNFIAGSLGTLDIRIRECATAADCNDGIACTVDSCGGDFQCVNAPDHGSCDDGTFCNGAEICNPQVGCESPGDPCIGQGLVCKEPPGQCVECLSAGDCDDGLDCTDDTCDSDVCVFSNNCSDDGIFCNGVELCDPPSNSCQSSGDPCPGFCDEVDGCPACEVPLVEAAGSRYLAITPQPIVNPAPTAFLVESPDWPCLSKYVGAFLRCDGTGGICRTDADCNSCTLLNTGCSTDDDCKTCEGTTNPCQTSADCDNGALQCESVQTCQISGLTCDTTGFLDEIDIDKDGIADGVVATLVNDPADRTELTAEEWGTTSYFRCSQSQEPCVIDGDCDVGQCAVSGRGCSIAADDCLNLCDIGGTECGSDFECPIPGDTCSVPQSCVLFETCQPGKIYVVSGDLFPSDVDKTTGEFFPISYTVRADCGSLTSAASAQMHLWSDTDNNGLVNIADALLIILGFQGTYAPAIPTRTTTVFDLAGSSCTPNQVISINDVFAAILAFKGDRFDPDVLTTSTPQCGRPCP